MSGGRVSVAELKKILFISFYYPPAGGVGLPGSQRAVKFVRHMRNIPVILSVKPQKYVPHLKLNYNLRLPIKKELIYRTQLFDYFSLVLNVRRLIRKLQRKITADKGLETDLKTCQRATPLLGKVPIQNSLKQKMKDFIYNLCYFPDPACGWILPGVYTGLKILRTHQIDIVFATGMPWSALVIAWVLNKFTKIPFVVDFRDPWIGNPFQASKGAVLDRVTLWLEHQIVSSAALVSANTDKLKDEMENRYPDLQSNKFIVLPNGFDTEDYKKVLNKKRKSALSGSEEMVILHAGYLYGQRDPFPIVKALVQFQKQRYENKEKIKFIQMGDIHLQYNFEQRFQNLIENGFIEVMESLPFNESLKIQANSDVLVLIQPGTKTQIPSKLYDYLCLNRPILTITPLNGALWKLIKKEKFGYLYEPEDVKGIVQCLIKLFEEKKNKGYLSSKYPAKEKYSIEKITMSLENRFTKILN